jgi:hypothetical protein
MQLEKSLHDSQIHQRFCPFYHRKFDVFDVNIIFTTEKDHGNDGKYIMFDHVSGPWVASF